MKPIPVLIVPHYNRPDLTARCLASIDYPVEKLALILNGGPKSDAIWLASHLMYGPGGGQIGLIPDCVKEIVLIYHPNAGVAGAWNEGIKLFPADWWLIANNDIQFAEGDMEGFARRMEDHGVQTPLVLYGNHGASWFAVTAAAIHCVGLFDENIFPAYMEDCDFGYRCDLMGVKRITCHGMNAIHGDDQLKGSCTIHSNPDLARQNCRTHGGNFVYYEAKWGGKNGEEKFKHPFNDPNIPVWAWRFLPQMRRNQQWGT